jgi:hypothetical protein
VTLITSQAAIEFFHTDLHTGLYICGIDFSPQFMSVVVRTAPHRNNVFFGCLLFALVWFSSGCFRFFFCFFRLLVNGKFDRCGGGFISVRHTSRRSLEGSRQIFGRRVVRTTDESNNNCTSPSVSVVVSFVVGSVE